MIVLLLSLFYAGIVHVIVLGSWSFLTGHLDDLPVTFVCICRFRGFVLDYRHCRSFCHVFFRWSASVWWLLLLSFVTRTYNLEESYYRHFIVSARKQHVIVNNYVYHLFYIHCSVHHYNCSKIITNKMTLLEYPLFQG